MVTLWFLNRFIFNCQYDKSANLSKLQVKLDIYSDI